MFSIEAPSELAGAAVEIRQGATRLARRLRAERPSRELSLGKLGVLADLNGQATVTVGALAAAANQRPQSLTRLLAELASDGLLTRTRDERDHRQILLQITPAGREALRRDMAGRDEWLTGALKHLSVTELGVLRLAARLMDRLAELEA